MFASSYWLWNRPSWGVAEVWAIALLAIPSLLIRRGGQSFFASLVNGKDNRWSTSKMSVVLWTYGLLFAFLTILLHTRGVGLDDLEVPEQYLLLLGIPAGGAVAAAGITQSKVKDNPTFKPALNSPPVAVEGVGQLVSDDSGRSDLLDAQYLAFSVLLLGYFMLQFLTGESLVLPTLPDGLVGLTGVSAIGYVAKKGVQGEP